MLREEWNEIEENVSVMAGEIKDKLLKAFKVSKSKVEKVVERDPKEVKEEFIRWGEQYVEDLKKKADGPKAQKAKENFFVLLRNLGVNEKVVMEVFKQNRKEVLDPLIGELVAIVALVLGWKQKDKEAFSQALGEIGVAGIFDPEAFKKGGVLGIAGITAITLSPSGFIGLLSAIVAILYLNKRIKVDRPVEAQLKELFQHIKNGAFFKEVRSSWQDLQDFISKVLKNIRNQETGIQPTN